MGRSEEGSEIGGILTLVAGKANGFEKDTQLKQLILTEHLDKRFVNDGCRLH
jgi:hypothetical protein